MATCDRWEGPIEEEGNAYANQTLCEDCYMEKVRGEMREGRKVLCLW